MPNTIDEFSDIRKVISTFLFGKKPDKILVGINTYIIHFQNIREALIESHFPNLVINLVYYPLYFLTMLLNCIRETMMFWIVFIILYLVIMMVVGAFLSAALVVYRGFKIYTSKYDWEGNDKNKDDHSKKD
jgi:hypothetical protein